MKKVVFFIALIFFSLSLISALDISLTKSSYYTGETLQAEIPDAFVNPLTLENIGIYQGDNVHKTPVETGLVKIDNTYHYYAVLPLTAGDYSIKIEAKHYEGSIETDSVIIKPFKITSTNTSYLSVNPGAISATSDFSITIKSYGGIQDATVEFQEADFKQTQTIGYNKEKTFYISIAKIKNLTKSKIKAGTYSIPVIISPSHYENETNITLVEEEIDIEEVLEFKPEEINATILKDFDYEFEILILNRGDKTLKNITIKPSDEAISISPNNFDLYAEKTIKLTINTDANIEGFIELDYKNQSIEIPVNIIITRNESAIEYNIVPENEKKTCKEAGGYKCKDDENCEGGNYRVYLDGSCCMSRCIKKESSNAWLWGILILAVLGIVGYLLYQKYQSGGDFKEKVDNIFKKRAEEYKERIQPHENLEVSKSLSKI